MTAPAIAWDNTLRADDGRTIKLVWGGVSDVSHCVARAAAELGVDTVLCLPLKLGRSGDAVFLPSLWREAVDVEGKQIVVVAPQLAEDGAAGPFLGLTPEDLYRCLHAFHSVIGVHWAGTVGQTAERLIWSTHPRERGGRQADRAEAAVPEPAQSRNLELAYSWCRELAGDEKRMRYVHAFDKNAMYLGAWITAELGFGQPVHHSRPRFDPARAGLWRLDGLPAGLPMHLSPAPWTPEREWFTTPTVARLLDVCEGYAAPLVEEAWIWPEKARWFRAAGEKINKARLESADVRARARRDLAFGDELALRRFVTADVVYEATKALYQRQTGRLLMDRHASTGFARPDWAHTIIATARVNLHRDILRIRARPFAISVDGLLFASNIADPEQFASQIGLKLDPLALGHYKHVGSGPLEPVAQLLADGVTNVNALFGAVAPETENINA